MSFKFEKKATEIRVYYQSFSDLALTKYEAEPSSLNFLVVFVRHAWMSYNGHQNQIRKVFVVRIAKKSGIIFSAYW